jgi:hypothetical protein
MNAGQEQGNIFGYRAYAAKGQLRRPMRPKSGGSFAGFVGLLPQLNRN